MEQVVDRYAKAFVDIPASPQQLTERISELEAIVEGFDKVPEALRYLQDPQFSYDEKEHCLQKTFKERVDKTVYYFLLTVLKKKRFDFFSKIVEKAREISFKRAGNLCVKLTTFFPLTDAQKEQFKAKIKAYFQKDVYVHYQVDPNILGGVVLEVNDKVMDASVATQLDNLKREMLALQL